MKNLLLGIIAINLTFISGNLIFKSVEPVYAEDQRSKYSIRTIIEDCSVKGDVYIYSENYGELDSGRIYC